MFGGFIALVLVIGVGEFLCFRERAFRLMK